MCTCFLAALTQALAQAHKIKSYNLITSPLVDFRSVMTLLLLRELVKIYINRQNVYYTDGTQAKNPSL